MEIDYKALYVKSEEARRQAEQGQQRAEARERELEEQQKQTSLAEFLRHCHNILSRPLRVRTPSTSTTGDIPMPTGKHCPERLQRWVECEAQQQRFYNSVRCYLQPAEDAPHPFPPRIVLDGLSKHFTGSMGAEYDLQTYERLAVEDHTCYISQNYARSLPPEKSSDLAMEFCLKIIPMYLTRPISATQI